MSAPARECDVLIVGGGLVGSALARALSLVPLSTVLVETRDPAILEQPSFDARVTALANGSRRILEGLGIWRSIAHAAEPIESIHVSERGQLGNALIRATEEKVAALGYTLENRVLGRHLWEALDACERFVPIAPATLVDAEIAGECVTASIERRGSREQVRARLLVAADGAESALRRELGIAAHQDDYGQCALIVNCTTERAHTGMAFERFTPEGPIAFLPMTENRLAVVWTLERSRAEERMAAPEHKFRAALQDAFGYRLGRISRTGRRALHPLKRVVSERICADRAVLIGNAALALHPVAGQGFNVALRDVAALAEVLADESRLGSDIGVPEVLARYQQWRRRDRQTVAGFTHGLVRLFGAPLPGLGPLRGLGLLAFDRVPGGKAWLARQTMGLTGRLPRLARGLAL